MILDLELLKFNTSLKQFIKASDQSKEELKKLAQIPFEKLKGFCRINLSTI